LIKGRSSFHWRIAENTGTATGVAVGPAGAVGGTVGIVLSAAATGMRRFVGGNSHRFIVVFQWIRQGMVSNFMDAW
jgi:hypothetical protein